MRSEEKLQYSEMPAFIWVKIETFPAPDNSTNLLTVAYNSKPFGEDEYMALVTDFGKTWALAHRRGSPFLVDEASVKTILAGKQQEFEPAAQLMVRACKLHYTQRTGSYVFILFTICKLRDTRAGGQC